MADERTPRIERANDTRPSDAWVPPSTLPDPTPVPGWTFRWIRTGSLGTADNSNVSMRFREGWEPVRIEEVPELQVMSDVGTRFEGCVEVGGLLLCKAPEEKMAARQKYYREQAENQMAAVDERFMGENDPRMPLLKPDRQTRTTFGSD